MIIMAGVMGPPAPPPPPPGPNGPAPPPAPVVVADMSDEERDFALKCAIIAEIRLRPLIYNKGHPKHYIRNARILEFDGAGFVVGIPGEYK